MRNKLTGHSKYLAAAEQQHDATSTDQDTAYEAV